MIKLPPGSRPIVAMACSMSPVIRTGTIPLALQTLEQPPPLIGKRNEIEDCIRVEHEGNAGDVWCNVPEQLHPLSPYGLSSTAYQNPGHVTARIARL